MVSGGNYGWVQAMGPLEPYRSVQDHRGESLHGADLRRGAAAGALPALDGGQHAGRGTGRAVHAAGGDLSDPEFSWRYAVAPSGLGFVRGPLLGTRFAGTLWSGMGRTTDLTGGTSGTYAGGALLAFRLTGDRQHLDLTADARLADRVADNGTCIRRQRARRPPRRASSSTAARASRCSSGRGSAPSPTFRPDPTRRSTSCRAPTTPCIASSARRRRRRSCRMWRARRARVASTRVPSRCRGAVSDDFGVTSSTGCGTTTLVDDTAGTTVTCSATNAHRAHGHGLRHDCHRPELHGLPGHVGHARARFPIRRAPARPERRVT